MNVPLLDPLAVYEECREALDAAYQRYMRSDQMVLGREVAAFESEYAEFCEAEYAVGVGHGLDALLLALRVLQIGPGDEVIVPANTYIATWLAVSHAGAVPVPVEPSAATYNLDPARIEAAITARTRAVLAVNLYGRPCDYRSLRTICEEKGLLFLVDNAQGHGALFEGRRVGGLADLECHSFYPTKNLGAYGEAGAITTNRPAWASKLRTLRNYGSRVRGENELRGYNSRLDELQAAFLRVKLARLDEWNGRRNRVAAVYRRGLAGMREMVLPMADAGSVHHQFVIRHPRRDALRAHLASRGVATLVHYPIPPHLSECYRELSYQPGSFPISEQLAAEVLSLPMHPHLSDAEIEWVIESLTDFSAEPTAQTAASYALS